MSKDFKSPMNKLDNNSTKIDWKDIGVDVVLASGAAGVTWMFTQSTLATTAATGLTASLSARYNLSAKVRQAFKNISSENKDPKPSA